MKPLIAASLWLACIGLTHQPLWNPGSPTVAQAYRVMDPTVSKVVTGQLGARQLAYLAFELEAGFVLDIGLFVGAACPASFQLRLWLVGPGLPKASPPFALPEGAGAKLFGGNWISYQGHGIFARKGPELREKLSGGTYWLVVESGEVGGFYMVSLGGAEVGGGTAEGRAAIGRFNKCG